MKQIAVRLDDDEVEVIDRLVADGRATSRADAVRCVVRDLITRRREDEIVASYERARRTTHGELEDWSQAAQAWDELPPWDGPVPASW
jgi:Arc/MetJ-type ribon-helix-helix transcriptional regulator